MAKTYSTCTIDGCDKDAKAAKGWCWEHYANNRRHGTPTPPRPQKLTLNEKMDQIGWDVTESGCWEWRGRRLPGGYGTIPHPKGSTWLYLHRLMYERYVGPIPEGLFIRHKCDNPPCSNPAHLEPGTHADNMRDMAERGRARNAYSLGVVRYGTTTDGKVATKCRKRGHDITAEDALIRFDDGKVKCRACLPLDHAASREKRFKTRRTRLGS